MRSQILRTDKTNATAKNKIQAHTLPSLEAFANLPAMHVSPKPRQPRYKKKEKTQMITMRSSRDPKTPADRRSMSPHKAFRHGGSPLYLSPMNLSKVPPPPIFLSS
eukprot:GHVO01024311.1.p2 GENE.GHVO01024311.1~~GHVO01024311.1.p2  ORF type:complete len:106 (-),score=25.83 GHVO01024311.1:463-780(-)